MCVLIDLVVSCVPVILSSWLVYELFTHVCSLGYRWFSWPAQCDRWLFWHWHSRRTWSAWEIICFCKALIDYYANFMPGPLVASAGKGVGSVPWMHLLCISSIRCHIASCSIQVFRLIVQCYPGQPATYNVLYYTSTVKAYIRTPGGTLAHIQKPSTVLPRLSEHLWAERFYRLFW